jgi:hypothetical protein
VPRGPSSKFETTLPAHYNLLQFLKLYPHDLGSDACAQVFERYNGCELLVIASEMCAVREEKNIIVKVRDLLRISRAGLS